MDDAGNGFPFIGLADPEIVNRAAGAPLLLAELASLFDPDARPGQPLPVSDIVNATVDEREDHSTLTARELEVIMIIELPQ